MRAAPLPDSQDVAPAALAVRGRSLPSSVCSTSWSPSRPWAWTMPELQPLRQPYGVHGHRERVEPIEKANANKLAELHFDSPESAGYRNNAPLTQITQVQYWLRGDVGYADDSRDNPEVVPGA
jgi:hypothetical protein